MSRSIEQIQAEYNALAAQLGHAVYQLEEALPKQIREIKAKISDLNAEANEVLAKMKAEQAEKAVSDETKSD